MLVQDYQLICELSELKCKLVKHILNKEGSLNILRKIDTVFNFLTFEINNQDIELRQRFVSEVLTNGFIDIKADGARQLLSAFLDTIFDNVIVNCTPIEVYTWWSSFADSYLSEFKHLHYASWIREEYLILVMDLGSSILTSYELLKDNFDGFGEDKSRAISSLWNHCYSLSRVSETIV